MWTILNYIVYKVELVDKRYRINFMKQKHYDNIPHPLSHTKVVYLFKHLSTIYYLT